MKRFLVFTLFIILTYNVFGQLFKIGNHEIGFIYVGPKVGMNLSKISNWSEFGTVDNKYKFGYQIGAVGEFGLTNRFSFQSELTFISKGIQFDNSKIRTTYLGIPLLAKLSFRFMGLRKVYAMGGSYQNIRTGGAFVYNDFSEPLSSEGWRRVDWGLMIGAGAEYPTDHGIFGLDLRYELGLLDAHISDAAKNRHSTFGFTFVYKYDLVDLMLKLRKKKVDPDAQSGLN